MGRGIALLFHDHDTRRGWVVSSTARPYFTPGKDPVPIVQEAGWASGPVWRGRKSRSTGNRSPNRPACSQSLYRLSYPAHIDDIYRVKLYRTQIKIKCVQIYETDKILFELVEGYFLMPSSCVHYERTLCVLLYDILGYFSLCTKNKTAY